MDRLAGRVAIVTGAARGIGQGIALRLVEEGARLVLTDIDPAGAQTAEAMGARFIQQDVSSEASWQSLLREVEDDFGALHALVNNAGFNGSPSHGKDPESAELADWNAIFAVNATSAFIGCKAALPLMIRSGGGAIVNISSIGSIVPEPQLTAYGAAKASVDHYSRILALHCARSGYRIRCNTVHPGLVKTGLVEGLFDQLERVASVKREDAEAIMLSRLPQGEYQEPRDIGNAVLFLLSDDARHITGQALAVDGGFALAN